MKGIAISTILIFLVFSIIDFITHGQLLMTTYKETSDLWRPMGEMKTGLMSFLIIVLAFGMSLLYRYFVSGKCAYQGTIFGLILGAMFGLSMGFGSYAVMPISFGLALSWFFIETIKFTLGGLIIGLIIK